MLIKSLFASSHCFKFVTTNELLTNSKLPMSRVKILLRAVKVEVPDPKEQAEKQDIKQKDKLLLFDSNRNAGFNELTTFVNAGDKVIWKPDKCSGITEIVKVYAKEKNGLIFAMEPKKRCFLFRGWKMRIPKDVPRGTDEAYGIVYRIYDGTEIDIDPHLRLPPPN